MVNASPNAGSNADTSAEQSPSAAEAKQKILREISAKWGKFSEQLSALKGRDDLVMQVVAK